MEYPSLLFIVATIFAAFVTSSTNAIAFESCDASLGYGGITIQPDAQAYIGTLMSLRFKGEDGYGCGELNPGEEMPQAFEAMKWALGKLNQDSGQINGVTITDSYVPGVKIGMLFRETCGRTELTTTKATEFLPQLQSKAEWCNYNDSHIFMGMIGESDNARTVQLTSVLQDFDVGTLSPFANQPDLTSDPNTYPYFLRTVPSDTTQAEVLVKTMKELQWEYFAIIYSEGTYGLPGKDALVAQAAAKGLCVAGLIPVDPTADAVDSARDALYKAVQMGVTGVVYLMYDPRVILENVQTVPGAGQLQFMFPDTLGPDDKMAESLKYARGVVTVAIHSRHIPEFEDHWVNLDFTQPIPDNPWLQEWYMIKEVCRLPGVDTAPFNTYPDCNLKSESELRDEYKQMEYTENAIMGVYTYARALKDAQRNLCGSSRGLCRDLIELEPKTFYEDYVQEVDITFSNDERIPTLATSNQAPYNAAKRVRYDANGDLRQPMYDVWSFNDYDGDYKFQQVATYTIGDAQLDLNMNKVIFYDEFRDDRLSVNPTSLCPNGRCSGCVSPDAVEGVQYATIDGDILIGGTFSVHNQGDDALTCGEINKSGAQLLQAFLYAVNKVNQEGILRSGVKLGAIALDECGSALVTSSTLREFHSGLLDSPSGDVDPSRVQAYVGSSNNEITKQTYAVIDELELLLVGYRAMGSDLEGDRYARTLVSDDQQARALLLLLRKQGWKYVQLIHEDTDEARALSMELAKYAKERGVCISKFFEIGDNAYNDEIILELDSMSNAEVLVLIGYGTVQRKVLEALNRTEKANRFTLVSSRGMMPGTIKDLEVFAEGSLTINFPETTLDEFSDHLQDLDPETYNTNPWFEEWYESMYGCYLDSSDMKGYTTQCTGLPITSSDQYMQDPHSVFVINAVYALAHGLDGALSYYCGPTYSSVCSMYMNAVDRSVLLLLKTMRAEFQSEADMPFKFSKNRRFKQALWPLNIYNVVSGSFVKVGEYTSTADGGQFDFNTNNLEYGTGPSKPMPECMGSCNECQYLYEGSSYVIEEGDLYIGSIYDVRKKGANPFGCSDVATDRAYQYTEAFRYALEEVNSGRAPVSVKGVKLGGIVLDDCSSKLRAAHLAGEIHSQSITLPLSDGMSTLDPDQIFTWISRTNNATVEMADIVSEFGMPQLTTGSASISVNDRDRLQTLFNVMNTDDKMLQGIVRLLQQMGWKYVQLVHTLGLRERLGADEMVRAARELGICVLATYEQGTDGTYEEIVEKLKDAPTDVVLYLGDMDELREMLEAKQSVSGAERLIFLATNLPRRDHTESLDDIKNEIGPGAASMLAFEPKSPTVDDFDTYLSTKYPDTYMDNPWFHDYYQKLHKCDLGPKYSNFEFGVSCSLTDSKALTDADDYEQATLLINNINAVYAAAEALNLVLVETCGTNYDGLCDEFDELDGFSLFVEKMEEVTFTDPVGRNFRFIDRQVDIGYNIYQFDGTGDYTEVGTYVGNTLNITNDDLQNQYAAVDSECGNLCARCEEEQDEEEMIYTEGDIILAGVFDVHEAGSSLFTCGDINTDHGYQLMEAFNYAIDYVNRKQGVFSNMLKDITLGSLVLDACKSPTRAGNLVANVHAKVLTAQDGSIATDAIMAYIGAYDSDSSKQMAGVLSGLDIPQISYGSISAQLQDTDEYPYFLRTVPGDQVQANGMVALLRRYDINYIQLIHSPDTYGEGAADTFLKTAEAKGICVAQTISFDEADRITNEMANRVVSKMVEKPNASFAVVYLSTEYIHPFLEAVNSNAQAKGKFIFIGSEAWEKREDVVDGVESAAFGSVTFGVETSDITAFDDFLSKNVPGQTTDNGWYDEYYQELLQCSLQSGNPDFPRVCDSSDHILNTDRGYEQDSYVIYAVNAVYAAAIGINTALEHICGKDNGLCDEFLTNTDLREEVFRGIREATFQDQAGQIFQFNENGESNRGFHIYSLTETTGGSFYYDQRIGSYEPTSDKQLDINIDFRFNWISNCEQEGACLECSNLEHTSTHIAEKPSPSDNNFVAFFDLHKPNPDDPTKCGEIDIGGGMQNFLAYYYAMDQFNAKNDVPEESKVGGMAIDTCGNPIRVITDVFSMQSGGGPCDASGAIKPNSVKGYVVMGSDNAIEANKLLAPSNITTISPSATTTELNGAPYFARTVPPDNIQADAMAAILREQGWYYVAIVNSDNSYGRGGRDAFMQAANDSKVCVASSLSLKTDAAIADARAAAKDVLQEIGQKKGVAVIVLFTTSEDARLLLEAADDMDIKGKYIFLGSDRWADQEEIVDGMDDYARGSISLKVQSAISKGFMDWVKSLTIAEHGDIPDDWFEEFWQYALQCKLENATVVQSRFTRACTTSDRLTDDNIEQNSYVLHTIISTQMLAGAAQTVKKCQKENPKNLDLCDSLFDTLKDSKWESPLGELENNDTFTLEFNDDAYGDIGYDILNYKRPIVGEKGYEYVQVGSYTEDDGLDFNQDVYVSYDSQGNTRSALTSVCPTGSTCECLEATGGGNNGRDGGTVTAAPQSAKSGDDNFDETWAIVLLVLTGLGILVTLLLFVYLLIMYPMKGGTSVLGYMLLFGVLCVYTINFAFLLYPDDVVCGIRRLCLGLAYAICFSAMLVKVLNTWRIGDELDMSYAAPTYERLSHPCSLFLIAVFLSLVQAIIGVEWLILDEPGWEYIMLDGEKTPWCSPEEDHNLQMIISCIYVMLLILLTLIFSATTWDSEENHRESRWILATTFFTIGCWIVWGIISTSTDREYRDPAVVIANLVNATVILLCIFFRKLVLLRKYNEELEEERRSRLSYQDTTLSRGNGAVYINQGYDGNGTLGSQKSPSYVYDASGGDIAY